MRFKNYVHSLISAIRTLTVIPVPGKDTDRFESSIPYFPLVGGILALCTFVLFKISTFFSAISILPGIVILVGILYLTGAIHLDGLADVADGFGGGKTRERILEILKDSRLGTFGVTALVIDVLIKTAIYTWCCEKNIFLLIGYSIIWSRMFLSIALIFLPSATPNKGIAASFCNGSGYKFPVVIIFIVLFLASSILINFSFVVITIFCTIVFFVLFSFYTLKKINGITGDCLGAINECTEIIILLIGCLLYKHTAIYPIKNVLSTFIN